ncbi:hypothetical protein R1sor_004618 [Riccia sorocarpa]|uniref:Uncharacterized protein n=1 Tax=Riccia sorocarpa TaxID=122646 RepID=A0ABD3HK51_9MARC
MKGRKSEKFAGRLNPFQLVQIEDRRAASKYKAVESEAVRVAQSLTSVFWSVKASTLCITNSSLPVAGRASSFPSFRLREERVDRSGV